MNRVSEDGKTFTGCLEAISSRYSPEWSLFLHGLYYEPLLAAKLPAHKSLSVFYLIESTAMEAVAEADTPLYTAVRTLEVLALIAAKRIWAISRGMCDSMRRSLARLNNDAVYSEVAKNSVKWGITCPTSAEQAITEFDRKVIIRPLPIDPLFFSASRGSLRHGEVASWGRLAPEKGFEHLIAAARRFPSLSFSLWGSRPLQQAARQAYWQDLETRAAACGNVVMDFRRWHSVPEVIERLDRAEVVVIPSLHEPYGLVVVEAMARAKAVIATDTDGPRDMFESSSLGRHKFGYLVSRQPSTLAKGIADALEDFFSLSRAERESMGEAASKRAAELNDMRIFQAVDEL